jgi:hypothetical protein
MVTRGQALLAKQFCPQFMGRGCLGVICPYGWSSLPDLLPTLDAVAYSRASLPLLGEVVEVMN